MESWRKGVKGSESEVMSGKELWRKSHLKTRLGKLV